MTITDIIKKVRELEIRSRKLASNVFTGEYHSAFKGKGMTFKEVREYAAGDDIRFIDWNVSARFGHPFSKVFEEERELTVMLLVDVSDSTLFGTIGSAKMAIAIEIAAVLAFSAVNNGDKAGIILYSDGIEKFIPPKKGKQHALYIVRELLSAKSKRSGTQLNKALSFFAATSRQKSIAFIISDFIDANYSEALRIAGNRHDITGIKLWDKMDKDLPEAGLLCIEDAENGERRWVDSGSRLVRHEYEKEFFRVTEYSNAAFKKAGSHLLHVRTDEDYVKVLHRFFISRNK